MKPGNARLTGWTLAGQIPDGSCISSRWLLLPETVTYLNARSSVESKVTRQRKFRHQENLVKPDLRGTIRTLTGADPDPGAQSPNAARELLAKKEIELTGNLIY
jgi:hypothetical protein